MGRSYFGYVHLRSGVSLVSQPYLASGYVKPFIGFPGTCMSRDKEAELHGLSVMSS